MKKVRDALLMLLALLCLPLCPAGAEGPGHLTLMVYMCGSDLESMFGSATEDLLEMREACAGNDAVTVLLMTGGASLWTADWIDGEETAIYEIGARGTRKLRSFPEMNMGRADTLSAFLEYGYANRPAEQYALILWDHGGGPMEGVCFDQNNGMDSLSLQEMDDGLRASPFSGKARLSWIGFDACLMATLETAIRCAPYADHMIASQEAEPASGWNYAFLREVRRGRGAREVCDAILDLYPADKREADLLTLSLVRLDGMPELERRTDLFFDAVRAQLDNETYPAFSVGRQQTKSFGRVTTASDYDLVDLADLVERYSAYAPEEAADLTQALSRAVLRAAGDREHVGGLSIYFPYYNKSAFSQKWLDTFRRLGILTEYRRFIDRFGAILTGEPLDIWGHLKGSAGELTREGTQSVFLELTDDQLTHYTEGFVTILEDDGSGDIFYAIDQIPLPAPDGTTLEAEVSVEALYAVDENGGVETTVIPYAVRGDRYLIFATLETLSWFDTSPEKEAQKIVLVCTEKEGTKELEIGSIIAVNDDTKDLNLGKQDFEPDPEKWPFIRFAGFPRSVRRDEEGSLLPFDQWPVEEYMRTLSMDGIDREGNRIPYREWYRGGKVPPGIHSDKEVDNTRPWTLRFCPLGTSGQDLAAQFEVMDTHGDRWGSDLIPLKRPDVYDSVLIDCEPREFDEITIRPHEVKLIRNDSFQGICLRVQVENHTDGLFMPNLLFPSINGIRRRAASSDGFSAVVGNRYIMPGTSGISDYFFDISCLPFREDPVVRTIGFDPHFSNGPTIDQMINGTCRVTAELELDISMLPLPERPEDPVAVDSTPDGLVMELLRLQEGGPGEPSVLRGTVRVTNPTEDTILFESIRGRSDDLYTLDLNGICIRDCLHAASYDILPPGGEGYYEFEVRADGDRTLRASDGIQFSGFDRRPREEALDRIDEIGFFHRSVTSGAPDADPDAAYLHQFDLPEPLALKEPCRVLIE